MFGDYENGLIKLHRTMNEATHLQEPLNRQIAYDRLLAVVINLKSNSYERITYQVKNSASSFKRTTT